MATRLGVTFQLWVKVPCSQCNKPAFYKIDDKVPLCLDCYSQWPHIQTIDFLKNATMLNHAADEMAMVTGVRLGGGRIPVEDLAKAFQRSSILNNFHFTQPQVGILNTGSIQRIDQAISLSRGADTEEVAEKLKELTSIVVQSEELDAVAKNDVIELSDSLATELVGSRKLSTLTALTKEIKEKVGGVLVLSNAVDSLWRTIEELFK